MTLRAWVRATTKAELILQKQDTRNTLCGVIRCGTDVVEMEPDGDANKAAKEISLDRRFQTQRHSGVSDIKTLSWEFTRLLSEYRHHDRLEALPLRTLSVWKTKDTRSQSRRQRAKPWQRKGSRTPQRLWSEQLCWASKSRLEVSLLIWPSKLWGHRQSSFSGVVGMRASLK